ncbi:class I SAM-dependent methyltransferase [Tumidithrix elongata RA019]|uniref:Class I SAM-dependent methyltransferase n=1 Tax=Tumidithrix elongata BACA0141 TaxID=2716417 RepID=A0AAW9Q4E4_9CYAN|nr:class I SAM-dependent methyltransferase [Tumidithrix elongata RA019]
MQDWSQLLKDFHGKDLAQRKTWYGEIAENYNRVRPRYPAAIIARAIEHANLSTHASVPAKILELGCGPGIATLPFAQLGFSMVSLEPNLEASQIAKENCAQYPNVEIQNISFEEWEVESGSMHPDREAFPKEIGNRFDAVLAATSWHWIPPEVAYPKTWTALKEKGALILLWNTPPQLSYEIYQDLDRVYQNLAPSIPPYARYEPVETQIDHFGKFGQGILDSGRFTNLVYDKLVCEVTYSLDDYLALLSTLSAYIVLDPETRNTLFEGLRAELEKICGDRLPLSYVSALHVAQKIG